VNTQSNEKASLLKRREELKSRLEAIRRDVGRGLDRDSSERAIELENAEVLNEIARVAQEQLEQVDEKLAQFR
jgi:hypothetical protein